MNYHGSLCVGGGRTGGVHGAVDELERLAAALAAPAGVSAGIDCVLLHISDILLSVGYETPPQPRFGCMHKICKVLHLHLLLLKDIF